MFSIWFAINLNIVTWFTGFLGIAFGLSIQYSVIAIIIGNVAGAAFLALSSALPPLTVFSMVNCFAADRVEHRIMQ
ncbi:MAG: cytosine permease [Spirochaetia bacterium]